jgi:hypothetical protein
MQQTLCAALIGASSAIQLEEFHYANNNDWVKLGNYGTWDEDLMTIITESQQEEMSAEEALMAASETWDDAKLDFTASMKRAWTTLSSFHEARPTPEPELRTNYWADGMAAPEAPEGAAEVVESVTGDVEELQEAPAAIALPEYGF